MKKVSMFGAVYLILWKLFHVFLEGSPRENLRDAFGKKSLSGVRTRSNPTRNPDSRVVVVLPSGRIVRPGGPVSMQSTCSVPKACFSYSEACFSVVLLPCVFSFSHAMYREAAIESCTFRATSGMCPRTGLSLFRKVGDVGYFADKTQGLALW